LEFEAPIGVMVHGFGGYFEAWLYKDITISACQLIIVVAVVVFVDTR
jgi:hypothetical protein